MTDQIVEIKQNGTQYWVKTITLGLCIPLLIAAILFLAGEYTNMKVFMKGDRFTAEDGEGLKRRIANLEARKIPPPEQLQTNESLRQMDQLIWQEIYVLRRHHED